MYTLYSLYTTSHIAFGITENVNNEISDYNGTDVQVITLAESSDQETIRNFVDFLTNTLTSACTLSDFISQEQLNSLELTWTEQGQSYMNTVCPTGMQDVLQSNRRPIGGPQGCDHQRL